jgi:hypothetical protein
MEIDELSENDERLPKKPENQLDKHRSARRAVAEYDTRKDGASKITQSATGRVAWNWSAQLTPPGASYCVASHGCPVRRWNGTLSRQQGKVPISG